MSSQNLDTTIVHHFLKYIFRVLTDEGPVSRAVVVFDGPGELARRADFPAYKVRCRLVTGAAELVPQDVCARCRHASDHASRRAVRGSDRNLLPPRVSMPAAHWLHDCVVQL